MTGKLNVQMYLMIPIKWFLLTYFINLSSNLQTPCTCIYLISILACKISSREPPFQQTPPLTHLYHRTTLGTRIPAIGWIAPLVHRLVVTWTGHTSPSRPGTLLTDTEKPSPSDTAVYTAWPSGRCWLSCHRIYQWRNPAPCSKLFPFCHRDLKCQTWMKRMRCVCEIMYTCITNTCNLA